MEVLQQPRQSCPCDVLRALAACPEGPWGTVKRNVMKAWRDAQNGVKKVLKPRTPQGRKLVAKATICRNFVGLADLLDPRPCTDDPDGHICTEADALEEEEITAVVQAYERVLVDVFSKVLPAELSEELQQALADHEACAKNRVVAEALVQTGRLVQAGLAIEDLARLHARVMQLFSDTRAGAGKQ